MDEQVGGRFGDGRERAARPGDGTPHLLALQGWFLFGVFGVLGVLLIGVLGSAEPVELFLLLPVGAGMGMLAGVPAPTTACAPVAAGRMPTWRARGRSRPTIRSSRRCRTARAGTGWPRSA